MPITLAIDTAAPRLQLGLLLADGRVDVSVDEMATGQAEAIFARIAALLDRNGLDYADLERVAPWRARAAMSMKGEVISVVPGTTGFPLLAISR